MGPLAHVQGSRCRDKDALLHCPRLRVVTNHLSVSGYTLANLAYRNILGVCNIMVHV